MPYITKDRRGQNRLETAGDLNFAVTSLVNRYLVEQGLCYASINDVVGVLECAKLEVYRRLAGPYENQKIQQNGDVYDPELLKEAR
jgi:hypothetical protein